MKCYDCGTEVADGVEVCPKCNCPTEREKAVKCLQARVLSAQLETETAIQQLSRARSAMYAAAILTVANAVIVLLQSGSDTGWSTLSVMTGVIMAFLGVGFAVIAYFIRRAPLTLSIVGTVLSLLLLGGVLGIVIVAVMGLSIWFSVQYEQGIKHERELRAKLERLK